MSLSPKHERDSRPIPAHPYRDTALFHGGLAVVLVVITALTGGDVARAVVIAVAYFVAATAWTSWRFRERIRAQAVRSDGTEGGEGGTA
jgi:hypothetical protein